ncbi:MAG: cache domain-containing protein [Prochloraceae cyanobacterium]
MLVVVLFFSYLQEKQQRVRTAKNNARQETVRAAEEIEQKTRQLMNSAQAIADDLTSGKLNNEQLIDRLRRTSQQNPSFYQVGAAYVPYAYKPSLRLYAPFYTKRQGEMQLVQVESEYDYTEPKHDWYHRPITEGSVWLEPYFGRVAGTLLAEFGAPFYRKDLETRTSIPVGVISVNYSLDEVRNLITSLDLGKTGYGYLVSGQGTLIYHPLKEMVEARTNIFDLPTELNSEKIREIGSKGIKGESGAIDFIEPLTGESVWIFYQPIPSTGWFLGVKVYKEELLPLTESLKRKQLALSLGLIAFFFFLSLLLFRVWRGSIRSFWAVSGCTSVFLSAGIGYHWYLFLAESVYQTAEEIKINTRTDLQSFLSKRTQIAEASNQEPPVSIPTGIFIRTLKFEEAHNVFVTGYIWQKYYEGEHDGISRGFIMPDAIVATDLGGWTEAYRYKKGNVETVGWYFEVNLRQEFDYSKYPFDRKQIRLRLLPQDFHKNVILVPDLESYTQMIPRERPGLERNLVLPGWNLERSFFEYQLKNYDTNFGISNYVGQDKFPELEFTVLATRNFLTVFISNFMPILVVSIMMFAIQLIVSQKAQEEETRKFTALEIISVGGGLIFIVLLDQLNLRGTIITAGLIYLEYLYFALYLLIILITLNALLIALGTKFWLIEYQDNLIPKLFYWPVLLSLLLIVTWLSF